ncbi:hypothetical protein K443DRAFT_9204 [Laccaria amethystina LaAM-08-1]|uniref:Transmembrane protein n=1 Tax=Laccaria amethystina LaAM-08-1 TaxID=1095629 RepID=A0A0C9WMQ5_9AGAR|nr:hypothetical protein K443DRAFT_9204 [Laccaria amethystina LaAM-08-1]
MRNFFVLLSVSSILLPAVFAADNFPTYQANVRNESFGTGGGRDNHGNHVDISIPTAITHELCVAAGFGAGPGPKPLRWSIFSQQFSSWLLPWLALVSQLPFGSNDKLDNLDSVLLAIGSPALAAYSLALTALNGRWIARRFARFTYPNIRHAIRIFNNLQQAPLRIVKDGALLASLVVLPQNDDWWIELDDWLNDTHSWSISTVVSIAWGWAVIQLRISILTHYATMQPLSPIHRDQPVHDWSIRAARLTSIFLRRFGKLIATLNSIWIFVACMLQLSSSHGKCYCNDSSASPPQGHGHIVIMLVDHLATMLDTRISGVCLAAGVVVIYVGFVGLFNNPPLPD